MIGIGLGTQPEDLPGYIKAFKVEFPLFADPKKEIQKKVNVQAVPHAVLLDKNGKVLMSHSGFGSGILTRFRWGRMGQGKSIRRNRTEDFRFSCGWLTRGSCPVNETGADVLAGRFSFLKSCLRRPWRPSPGRFSLWWCQAIRSSSDRGIPGDASTLSAPARCGFSEGTTRACIGICPSWDRGRFWGNGTPDRGAPVSQRRDLGRDPPDGPLKRPF